MRMTISPYFQDGCFDFIKNYISQICHNDLIEKLNSKILNRKMNFYN